MQKKKYQETHGEKSQTIKEHTNQNGLAFMLEGETEGGWDGNFC